MVTASIALANQSEAAPQPGFSIYAHLPSSRAEKQRIY